MQLLNMLNQHFNDDFDKNLFVFSVAKNVMTFFQKSIYNYQYRVVAI